MHQKRGSRRDMLQNIAITVLAVSAVLLFLQTQRYMLLPDDGLMSGLFQAGSASDAPVQGTAQSLSAPVRVAVSGTYGRYGDISLSTDDADRFGRLLSPLLSEALGSAGTFSACTQTEFLSALSRTCVYYDFLSPLPLSILSVLAGMDTPVAFDLNARYVVVSQQSSTVDLLIWDGEDSFLRCGTSVRPSRLQDVVSSYELGNAAFAFDLAESDPAFEACAPCSLFLSPLPQYQTLSAGADVSDSSALLSALGFNPYANTRYTESNGTEVVMEGDQTLRISADGTLRYQSGGRASLFLADADHTPTPLEAVQGAWELVRELTDGRLGSASLYLTEVTVSDDTTVVRFGLHTGGTPIRFPDDGPAAEVRLSGSAVTALTVTLREYAATGESASLLPLKQASAIAALDPGRELSIAYVDSGTGSCTLSWLSD